MNEASEPVQTLLPLRTFVTLLNKSRGGFSKKGADEAIAPYAFLLHSSRHPARRIERAASTVLLLLACLILILVCPPAVSFAQPVALSPPQLDQLVARIALYPDPLLANILTASTFWEEIPEAAAWADQHSYLKGDAVARAIQADHLQWDPSILALLPFPSVLDMMARDPAWTEQLGNAVLTQHPDVMDAVQRMRQRARSYGYLTTNGYINVIANGGYIQILPVNPDVLYVPYYDPLVVFAPPRPGLAIAGAIRFGPAITIGAVFGGWGWWLGSGFGWPSHTILIDRRPWGRVWVDRAEYIHPYVHPWVRPVGPRVETHRLRR
ncbi:MAG TPA: DUF3300 domain-containing protein [Edaphobacter sp.]|nr:DUF3300 domain-containing protein [Edaphobacter sp.]